MKALKQSWIFYDTWIVLFFATYERLSSEHPGALCFSDVSYYGSIDGFMSPHIEPVYMVTWKPDLKVMVSL